MKETTKKTKQSLIGAMIFIMGMGGYQVSDLYFEKRNFNKSIEEFVTYTNGICPFTIDSETRLDSISFLPGKIIRYNYSLFNITREEIEAKFNMIDLIEYLEESLTAGVREDQSMEKLRKGKVTFDYRYYDKEGEYIHTISITPEKYK